MRLLRLALALLALTVVLTGTPRAEAAAGLRLIESARLSQRLREVTFITPSLKTPTKVRVLTPVNFDGSGKTKYPVLFLLHGGVGNYTDWTIHGDAEKLTAKFPFIVVMPDGGGFGNYVDWYNSGNGGPPKWETYHLRELLPWVEANYPTNSTRHGRAIAGLSMGGGGTMRYAARHPDLFGAAAAFSGAVDNSQVPTLALDGLSSLSESKIPGEIYGPTATHDIIRRGHNGLDLAENLSNTFLQLDTGNGYPGGPFGGGDPIEFEVGQRHDQLAQQARQTRHASHLEQLRPRWPLLALLAARPHRVVAEAPAALRRATPRALSPSRTKRSSRPSRCTATGS